MPIRLRCKCGQTLTAPDGSSGRKGKCSHCGTIFVVPDPDAIQTVSPVAPANVISPPQQNDLGLKSPPGGFSSDFDEDFSIDTGASASPGSRSVKAFTPQKRNTQGGSLEGGADMGSLSTAFKLMYWATMGLFLSTLAMVAILLTARAAGPGIILLLLPLTLVLFVSAIMMFIGKIMCLGVPAQVRAKGLIIGSLISDLIQFMLRVSLKAKIFPAMTLSFSIMMMFISMAIVIAGFVMFILFQKKLAIYIGRNDLAKLASLVLILTGVIFVLYLFGIAIVLAVGLEALWYFLILIPVAIAWLYFDLKLLQGLAYGL